MARTCMAFSLAMSTARPGGAPSAFCDAVSATPTPHSSICTHPQDGNLT